MSEKNGGRKAGKTQDSAQRSKEQKVRTWRLFAVDDAIRSGRYPNAATLAAFIEVDSRTIQRDIEYLRDMFDAPIEYSAAHRGYYYTEPTFYLKSVPLTEGELFSAALFDPLLEQYRNTPLEADLRAIFKKIVLSLPENVTVDTAFLSNSITFIPDSAAMIDVAVFKTVMSALKKRQTVTFDYRPLQKTTYMARTVDPYHGVCQHGNWYLLGRCHDRNDMRLFSFARIKNVALTKQGFAVPETFNPNDYIDKDVGVWASSRTPQTVELLVNSEIGTYALERKWHEGQEVKQNDDGSVYVKFTTTQMPEVLRFVLGQGHTVKALGPAELVEQVKAESERVRGMYE